MKKELTKQKDVELLVDSFYEKVFDDPVIGHFFTELRKKNWEKHRQTMIRFWGNVLFYTGDYFGNPIYVHNKVHQHSPLHMQDFNRWLELFTKTVDEHFTGENAELAKQRAYSIATVMQIKIFGQSGNTAIG